MYACQWEGFTQHAGILLFEKFPQNDNSKSKKKKPPAKKVKKRGKDYLKMNAKPLENKDLIKTIVDVIEKKKKGIQRLFQRNCMQNDQGTDNRDIDSILNGTQRKP